MDNIDREKLRTLRRKRGLSAIAMAESIGCNPRHYMVCEAGAASFTPVDTEILAKVLGVGHDELLYGT